MNNFQPKSFNITIYQICAQNSQGQITVVGGINSPHVIGKGQSDFAMNIFHDGANASVACDATSYKGPGRRHSFDSCSKTPACGLWKSDLCASKSYATTRPGKDKLARARVHRDEHALQTALQAGEECVKRPQQGKLEHDAFARNEPTKHSDEDYNEDLISKQETPALAKTSLQRISLDHIQTMSPDKAESNIVEDAMRIENAVTQGASQAQAEIRPELQEASLSSVQDAINDVDAKIEVLTPLFRNTAALWREKYGTLSESPFSYKARYSRESMIDIDLRTADDSWDRFVATYQQGRERYLQTSDAKRAIRYLENIFGTLELILEEGTKVHRLVAKLPGHDKRCDATSAPRGTRAVHQVVQYGKDKFAQTNYKAEEILESRRWICGAIQGIENKLLLYYTCRSATDERRRKAV